MRCGSYLYKNLILKKISKFKIFKLVNQSVSLPCLTLLLLNQACQEGGFKLLCIPVDSYEWGLYSIFTSFCSQGTGNKSVYKFQGGFLVFNLQLSFSKTFTETANSIFLLTKISDVSNTTQMPNVYVLSCFSYVWLFAALWSVARLSVHGILQARKLEWVAISFPTKAQYVASTGTFSSLIMPAQFSDHLNNCPAPACQRVWTWLLQLVLWGLIASWLTKI